MIFFLIHIRVPNLHCKLGRSLLYAKLSVVNVWGKRFKLPQLTHESFLAIDNSCKIFFWYLPNWTSTDLWCVVLYVTHSTTNQRSVEVQFGRYQKNISQVSSMAKKLSCVSCGSLKRFPHTFTTHTELEGQRMKLVCGELVCFIMIVFK